MRVADATGMIGSNTHTMRASFALLGKAFERMTEGLVYSLGPIRARQEEIKREFRREAHMARRERRQARHLKRRR